MLRLFVPYREIFFCRQRIFFSKLFSFSLNFSENYFLNSAIHLFFAFTPHKNNSLLISSPNRRNSVFVSFFFIFFRVLCLSSRANMCNILLSLVNFCSYPEKRNEIKHTGKRNEVNELFGYDVRCVVVFCTWIILFYALLSAQLWAIFSLFHYVF